MGTPHSEGDYIGLVEAGVADIGPNIRKLSQKGRICL